MNARLVLKDKPGAWIQFTTGGKTYRARMDPLWLGVERFPELLKDTRLVWQLLDEKSRMRAMLDDLFGSRTLVMLQDYAEAVGLGFGGLYHLDFALKHLDELEIDLLRLGFDITDWLDVSGPLSSRRAALIVGDLLDRPETQIGAARMDIPPVDKSAVVLAQIAGSMGKDAETHMYLKTRSELRAEAEARAEEQARINRIRKRW